MIKMRIFVLFGTICVAANVHADDVAQLRERGEALAKAGHYSEAIDAFKAADRKQPRANHACLIALAYTRRELWPQAEIFIAKCHQRAQPNDPAPDWLPKADQQIAERIAAAKVAAITIETDPRSDAVLTVSSFAPDESFEPRTIHLPFGHHVIFAKAPGFEPAQHEIDVKDGKPQRIVIHLDRVGERVAQPVAAAPVDSLPNADPLPRRLVIAGGATVAAAAILNVTLYLHFRNKLDGAQNLDDYNGYETDYDITRFTMFGLYGIGGAAVIAGAVLMYVKRDRDVSVGVAPIQGGAGVAMEWRR